MSVKIFILAASITPTIVMAAAVPPPPGFDAEQKIKETIEKFKKNVKWDKKEACLKDAELFVEAIAKV